MPSRCTSRALVNDATAKLLAMAPNITGNNCPELVDIDEYLLRAADVADEAAEHEAAGDGVAQRHAIAQNRTASGDEAERSSAAGP